MEREMEFCPTVYSEALQSVVENASADAVFDCESVEYKGSKYARGCIVLTEQTFYEWAVKFGRVQILLSNGTDQVYPVVEEFAGEFSCDLRA